MSTSAWIDQLIPDNVRLFPRARKDLLQLDKAQAVKVIKAIRKIAQAPTRFGAPLENQDGRPLAGFRKIYVDDKRIRVIWRVVNTNEVEIVVVIAVGKRDHLAVYEMAAERREEVERWIKEVVLRSVT